MKEAKIKLPLILLGDSDLHVEGENIDAKLQFFKIDAKLQFLRVI